MVFVLLFRNSPDVTLQLNPDCPGWDWTSEGRTAGPTCDHRCRLRYYSGFT